MIDLPWDLPSPALLARRLDGERGARVDALLVERGASVRAARAACDALWADPDAPVAHVLDDVARGLLRELRRGGGVPGWIDARLHSERPEILDGDGVPVAVRRFTMRLLAHLNARIGSYPVWARAVLDALGDRAAQGAHVYDLASGTGDFLRWLATHPPTGAHLRLTASDRDAAYVAEGARRAPPDLVCEVRDALALRAVTGVDLFVCTQATHHLSPGQVVRMISEASRAAPAGLLIVDLMRSLGVAAGTALVSSLVAPFPLLIADGVQSVRRAYSPAELTLLGRLAGAEHVEARPFGPAHATLHAWGRQAS